MNSFSIMLPQLNSAEDSFLTIYTGNLSEILPIGSFIIDIFHNNLTQGLYHYL